MGERFKFSLDGHFVCVFFSLKDDRLHIGFTTNLQIRLLERTLVKTPSTKGKSSYRKSFRKPSREPFKLIYYEVFFDEADAKARETFLKSKTGIKQLKVVLKSTLSNMGCKNL